MAILVGMDEAGYGPHLGPLVVAAASAEFRGEGAPDANLWRAMRGHVEQRADRAGGRVLVCDSKAAYTSGSPRKGLARLERAVLGFLTASGRTPRSMAELLAVAQVPSDDPAEAEPWHRPEALGLPAAGEGGEIEDAAGNFREGFACAGGRPGRLWISVTRPARLNRMIADGGRNKAQALFAVTAGILADIRHRHGGERLFVMMDQHGGRRRYGPLLAGAFPMDRVERLQESAEASRYRLTAPDGGTMELVVRQQCESRSLLAALASMAAKYVRELAMRQFNAYFRSRVPDLAPTAGYGHDAWRFLAAVRGAAEASGVPEEMILRSR